jgi:hypothetical protein
MRFFPIVTLIDAYLVDPEQDSFISKPQGFESGIKALCNREMSAINQNIGSSSFTAPRV